MGWLEWFGNAIWQPRKDERVERVQAEIDQIKEGMAELKERTAALEAFQKLAEDSSQ